MKKILILCLSLLQGIALAAPFPAGTFLYAGTIRDYRGEVVGLDSEVVIQAVATNGTVLGEARAVNATACAFNYRLEIPLSDVRCPMAALPGDILRCVVRMGGKTVYVSDEAFPPVGKANTAIRCDLVLGTDSDGDGVPDAYVEEMTAWLAAYGYDTYDASADYDGDGRSNYAEYVAGTDPFDPSDRLRVSESGRVTSDGLFSISFEYAGGRVYCVEGASELIAPAWARETFSTTPGGARGSSFTSPQGDRDVVTLYLLPEGDARFYQIIVNPENQPLECK